MNQHRRDWLGCTLAGALGTLWGPASAMTSPLDPARADSPWPAFHTAPLEAALRAQIEAQALPGVVVLVGDAGGVRWRWAAGERARRPAPEPMTADTVFDLASLTKVVATTTAVLQLIERGALRADDPVARHWSAFAQAGKHNVTVAQVLAHSSGLPAGWPDRRRPRSAAALWHALASMALRQPPGQTREYSDLGFLALGRVVEHVSGLTLDTYTRRHITNPLGLQDTGFAPDRRHASRIAPTEVLGDGHLLRGQAHDPLARTLGGVAGHAGLFGTADDLGRFARSLLGLPDVPALLQPDTVRGLLVPQPPVATAPWRGAGWLLQPPLTPTRDDLLPTGTLHHTGYTGTALWIDVLQQRYIVLLSHRVHPDGRGDARPARRQVAALLSSTGPTRPPGAWAQALGPTVMPPRPAPAPADGPRVLTGIDRWRERNFAELQGQRVGLVTHLAAVDRQGWRTLDRLRWAPGVHLRRIFTPEHGLFRDIDGPVASGTEPGSGLPLVSLYGAQRQPTPAQLADLDAIVVDLQDVGVRFFTYIATLGLVLDAARPRQLPVFVIDRPNPLGGVRIGGPVLEPQRRSFTGPASLAMVHGMTFGEIALWLAQDLRERTGSAPPVHVLDMQGWQRAWTFAQTGLDWVPPSPNLRTLQALALYPGTAWVEGTPVSVGRGTPEPFERVGAPWIDGHRLADDLNARHLAGLHFEPLRFQPTFGPGQGQDCGGVRIVARAPAEVDACAFGLHLVDSLWRGWPQAFPIDRTLDLIGDRATVDALKARTPPGDIIARWSQDQADFRARRASTLRYPEPAPAT